MWGQPPRLSGQAQRDLHLLNPRPDGHQTGKHRPSVNSPLHSRPHICYKQFTESSSVASRAKLSATLVARPASNDPRGHESLQSSRPRDFIRKGDTVSEGYLQSKDLQKDLFSIFCLPTRAVAKTHAPKVASTRPEGHTVARIHERQTQRFVIPNRAESPVRNLLLAGSSPESASQSNPDVENIWKSCGKPRLTGFRPQRMLARFRGQSVSL
jgi:hypothetical protein